MLRKRCIYEQEEQEESGETASGLPSEAKIGVVYARDIGTFSERFTGRLKGYLVQAGVSDDNIIERAVSAEELPDAVKDLVEEKCSVLVIDNAGDIPISSITDRASKAGIPILYFGMDPGEKERARWEKKGIKAAYVGGDDTKAAQMRADVLDKMDFSLIDLTEDREIGTIIIRDSDGSDAERINQETTKTERTTRAAKKPRTRRKSMSPRKRKAKRRTERIRKQRVKSRMRRSGK